VRPAPYDFRYELRPAIYELRHRPARVPNVNPFKFLLGRGQLPPQVRSSLEAEGINFLAEDLTGSITYRNYRAPGKRYGVAKQGTAAAIAISGQRLVVWVSRGSYIDIPLAMVGSAVEASSDQPDRMSFRYDAGRFRPETSGKVEIRLKTPQAAQIMNLLNAV
jgi:hypothetical protein